MDIDINKILDIDVNEVFYEFKFKLSKIYKNNFIYKKTIYLDPIKRFPLEDAYQSSFFQNLNIKKNVFVSFSNFWYLGMIALLNSLNPILDTNKLKKFLVISYLKNLFFSVLYILNYSLILSIFFFNSFEINWLNNAISPIFSVLISMCSFLVILIIHAVISRIINVFIKKILLKNIN